MADITPITDKKEELHAGVVNPSLDAPSENLNQPSEISYTRAYGGFPRHSSNRGCMYFLNSAIAPVAHRLASGDLTYILQMITSQAS